MSTLKENTYNHSTVQMNGALPMDRGDDMAKDDYFVIVYQILSYLYQCLKKGVGIDSKMIRYDSPNLNINKRYWLYIIDHLSEDGFIEGIIFADGIEGREPYDMRRCTITPKGIAYLCENSFMKRAVAFLKEAKEIIPFDLPI